MSWVKTQWNKFQMEVPGYNNNGPQLVLLFSCEYCDKVYVRRQELLDHKRAEHGSSFAVPQIPIIYTSTANQEIARNSGSSSSFAQENSGNLAAGVTRKIISSSGRQAPGSSGSNDVNQIPGIFEFYKEEVSSTVMNLHGDGADDDDQEEVEEQNARNPFEMDVDQNNLTTVATVPSSRQLPIQEVPVIELVQEFPENPVVNEQNFAGHQNQIIIVLESDDEKNSRQVELNKFSVQKVIKNSVPTTSRMPQNHSVSSSEFQSSSSAGYSGNQRQPENVGSNVSNQQGGSSNFTHASSQQQQPESFLIHRPLLKCLQAEIFQLAPTKLLKKDETWMNFHSQGSIQKQSRYRSHSSQQRWQNHSQPSHHHRRRNHSESPQKRRQEYSQASHSRWSQNPSEDSVSYVTSRPSKTFSSSAKSLSSSGMNEAIYSCRFCFESFNSGEERRRHEDERYVGRECNEAGEYECDFCSKIFYTLLSVRTHESICVKNPDFNSSFGKFAPQIGFSKATASTSHCRNETAVRQMKMGSQSGRQQTSTLAAPSYIPTCSTSSSANQLSQAGPPASSISNGNFAPVSAANSSSSRQSECTSTTNSKSDRSSEPLSAAQSIQVSASMASIARNIYNPPPVLVPEKSKFGVQENQVINMETGVKIPSENPSSSAPISLTSNDPHHHGPSAKKACYCAECNEKYAFRRPLVKCPLCLIHFKDRSALQQHFVGHKTSNPKALLCMSCGQWFRLSIQLKKHMANQCSNGQQK